MGDGGFILENEVATLGDGGIILENEVAVLGAAGFIRVGSALVTSGLVTMAFLLALRLLIRDFFEIDIACSLFLFSTDALFYCKVHAKVRTRTLRCAFAVESATSKTLVPVPTAFGRLRIALAVKN